MRPFSSLDLRVLYLCGVFHVCHVTIDSRGRLVVLVTLFHSAEVDADGGVGIFVGLRSRAHLGFKLRVWTLWPERCRGSVLPGQTPFAGRCQRSALVKGR